MKLRCAHSLFRRIPKSDRFNGFLFPKKFGDGVMGVGRTPSTNSTKAPKQKSSDLDAFGSFWVKVSQI